MKLSGMGLLLVGTLFLGACAPSAMSGSNAAEVSPLEAVKIAPGKSLLVAMKYPAAALELDESMVEGALNTDFFNNRDFNNNVKSYSQRLSWLSAQAQDVPTGWNISLVSADALREVLNTENSRTFTQVHYRDYVRVVYNISVPQNAESGRQYLMVKFKDPQGHGATVPVIVDVPGAGGKTTALK